MKDSRYRFVLDLKHFSSSFVLGETLHEECGRGANIKKKTEGKDYREHMRFISQFMTSFVVTKSLYWIKNVSIHGQFVACGLNPFRTCHS